MAKTELEKYVTELLLKIISLQGQQQALIDQINEAQLNLSELAADIVAAEYELDMANDALDDKAAS